MKLYENKEIFFNVSEFLICLHVIIDLFAFFIGIVLPDLHQNLGSLDLLVQWYNKVKQTTLEVEAPLMNKELETIDQQLHRAETELTWQDPRSWDYICILKDTIYQIERRLQKTKDNAEVMKVLLNGWSKQPMFCRKDNKKDTLLQLEDRAARVAKSYNNLRKDGETIHKLLQVRD